MNSMQGRPGNCFLHWSNKSETSAARHRDTSQRGRDLLLSYKFLSGVGAVLCTPTESERSPCASVQLDVHTHTHTHTEQVASCIVCADAKPINSVHH